jgi:hypothetical protein
MSLKKYITVQRKGFMHVYTRARSVDSLIKKGDEEDIKQLPYRVDWSQISVAKQS